MSDATDRRLWFFLAAAVASGLLTAPTPQEFRWVPITICVAYVVLAALFGISSWSRKDGPE